MHTPLHLATHMLMMFVPFLAIVFGLDLLRFRARRVQAAVTDRAERSDDGDRATRDRPAGARWTPLGDRAGERHTTDHRRLEPAVFRAAARLGGVLTVSDVVLETDLPVDASRALLERMSDGEHVRMEVTDRGRVEYHFPEILTRQV